MNKYLTFCSSFHYFVAHTPEISLSTLFPSRHSRAMPFSPTMHSETFQTHAQQNAVRSTN